MCGMGEIHCLLLETEIRLVDWTELSFCFHINSVNRHFKRMSGANLRKLTTERLGGDGNITAHACPGYKSRSRVIAEVAIDGAGQCSTIGEIMLLFVVHKVALCRFSPSISISLGESHSTNCFPIINHYSIRIYIVFDSVV